MRRLSDISIKHKLTAMNLLTSCVVLLVASVILVTSVGISYQRTIVQELETIAGIIGDNTAAAVTFDDRRSAEQILMALRAKRNIISARIDKGDGTVFAKYNRAALKDGSVDSPNSDDRDRGPAAAAAGRGASEGSQAYAMHFWGGYIDLSAPIHLNGAIIGTVFIRSDLQQIYSLIETYILISVSVFVLSIAIALLLSTAMQKVISGPILHLLNTIRGVSADQNYAVRAHKKGQDELGALIDGFNAMLAQIQARDESLIVARQEADSANHSKSDFLALMSHELRTPLNAIIGFSEILKDEIMGPIGNAKYRDYAKDVNDSGLHLLGLINDILDLAKIESGKLELAEEDVDTTAVIHSCVTLVKELAERAGVKLVTEIPDALPALRADERKLKQVLINLVSNAVKFTPPTGTVTIRTWCRTESGYVFQVIDTGIGIALEDIPNALEPFKQVDNTLSRKHEGTGLGLPLTKSLVEMHGGSLDLQSQVGVGTTVTVRFPAERIGQMQQVDKIRFAAA